MEHAYTPSTCETEASGLLEVWVILDLHNGIRPLKGKNLSLKTKIKTFRGKIRILKF